MTRLLVSLTALGLFATLAAYSCGKYVSREWEGPASQHLTLREFKDQKAAEAERHDAGVVYRAKSKVVYVWRDAKAAAIADALSLTPDSVDTRLP